MSMKMKNLLLVGAATLVASCSQNIDEGVASTNKEITFSHLNARITRADKLHNGANDNSDDYKVYAAIAQEDTKIGSSPITKPLESTNWYFVDEVYGKTTDRGTANQPKKGPYYWLSSGAALDFYAYAPASVVATGEPGNLNIAYTVNDRADEDLTIASPIENMTFEKTAPLGVINLQFYHVLSKIVISAELSNELTQSGYTIEPNYTASLTMKHKMGNISPTGSDRQWSIPSGENGNATYSGRTSYMVLPQDVEGNSLQLDDLVIKKNGLQVFPAKTHGGKSSTGKSLKKYILKASDIINGEKDIKDDLIRNDGTFMPGKQYNFKIVISNLSFDENGNPVFGKEIKFDANVADWSEERTSIRQ